MLAMQDELLNTALLLKAVALTGNNKLVSAMASKNVKTCHRKLHAIACIIRSPTSTSKDVATPGASQMGELTTCSAICIRCQCSNIYSRNSLYLTYPAGRFVVCSEACFIFLTSANAALRAD